MNLTPEEKELQQQILCKKIITTTYNAILFEMRFIDIALSTLKPEPSSKISYLATDGKTLYYNELSILQNYKISPKKVMSDILHVVMHCILLHLYYSKTFIPNWNLSCDIAVTQLLVSIGITITDTEKLEKLSFFEKNIKPFTAQNVLKFIYEQNYSKDELLALEQLFSVDEHQEWDKVREAEDEINATGNDNDNNSVLFLVNISQVSFDNLMNEWRNIANTVLINLESFSKLQGDKVGDFKQLLKEVTREKYDYTKFLKKFATRQEVSKVNDDEFDYIFYTYGLKMYENMPLIEPLEYKDDYKINDFVIAIDTSGSTSGEIVQLFLQKTYNILKNSESFSKKTNIYIIQCDALIQDIVVIKTENELEKYIKNLTIKGLGGTDFRPVFTYVNELVKEGYFTKLKGLIYFTDGYGYFPKQKTPYDTAFIFVDPTDYEHIDVPPWAMKVLLNGDEIKEFKRYKL